MINIKINELTEFFSAENKDICNIRDLVDLIGWKSTFRFLMTRPDGTKKLMLAFDEFLSRAQALDLKKQDADSFVSCLCLHINADMYSDFVSSIDFHFSQG